MKRICGIYEFINKVTDDIYVGQSVNILRRYKDHVERGDNSLIDKAIKEYGIDNFEFLIYKVIDDTNLSRKELKQKLNEEEIKRIEELGCCVNITGKGYNKSIGGGGTSYCKAWNKGKHPDGHPCTDEAKQKISKANKNKKRTKEQCENISKGAKKRYENPEERQKVSERRKGKPVLIDGHGVNYGKQFSDEYKQNMSLAMLGKNKGKKRTKEQCEYISIRTKEQMALPENKQNFLDAVRTDEYREKQRNKMKAYWTDEKRTEQSQRQMGYVWVNDTIKNYRIRPEELIDYISNGYIKGLLKKSHNNNVNL